MNPEEPPPSLEEQLKKALKGWRESYVAWKSEKALRETAEKLAHEQRHEFFDRREKIEQEVAAYKRLTNIRIAKIIPPPQPGVAQLQAELWNLKENARQVVIQKDRQITQLQRELLELKEDTTHAVAARAKILAEDKRFRKEIENNLRRESEANCDFREAKAGFTRAILAMRRKLDAAALNAEILQRRLDVMGSGREETFKPERPIWRGAGVPRKTHRPEDEEQLAASLTKRGVNSRVLPSSRRTER